MTRYLLNLLVFLLNFAGMEKITAQEEGIASYYHSKFHGKATASGKIHAPYELIAAHRTFPFGTFVRVTNLSNLKSVIVCIEDRGPFRKGWIIDVSRGAAEKLDFVRKGITKVRIEVVPSANELWKLDFIYPKIEEIDLDEIKPRIPLWVPIKTKTPNRKKHYR